MHKSWLVSRIFKARFPKVFIEKSNQSHVARLFVLQKGLYELFISGNKLALYSCFVSSYLESSEFHRTPQKFHRYRKKKKKQKTGQLC